MVLYHEEIQRDDLKAIQQYFRVKILSDAGLKYGTVEIRNWGKWRPSIEDLAGRTIHADGTVIPFTGKPHMAVVDGANDDYKEQQFVFSLPSVEVGSILEYSYTEIRSYYAAPSWTIQSELPIRSVHYEWRASNNLENQHQDVLHAVSWYPVLPAGAKVEHGGKGYKGIYVSEKDADYNTYSVTLKDLPPLLQEDYMPPRSSVEYGVRFAYASEIGAKYWANEGTIWSKAIDKFVNPNSDLKKATTEIVAGASTPEEKLRRIYAAVMNLENTAYTRRREVSEDKADGREKLTTVADLWQLKRGSARGLTSLFIGMARAAGLEAYVMAVPDRSVEVFTPDWLSFDQLEDEIAIVNLDGKERFFDPGSRYCGFGHLDWRHTQVQGVRQGPKGTSIERTPAEDFNANTTGRLANLAMADDGSVTGKIDLTYTGSAALRWRHISLSSDESELRTQLKDAIQADLPTTIEAEVKEITNLTDYEKPLHVTLSVSGSLGTTTGSRRILPIDLFVARKAEVFPQQTREQPIFLSYPESVQDALGITFAKSTDIEGSPPPLKLELPRKGAYDISVAAGPGSLIVRRHFVFAGTYVPVAEYAELHSFYAKLQNADHETVVLKLPAAKAGE